MTDKPTGVFVRLHDGALNEEQIAKLCNPKRSMTESLLTIGTPVTGGELEVVDYSAYEPEYHSEGMGCGLEDRGIHDRYEAMGYGWDQALDRACSEFPEAVLLSDSLAKLAEKDAEIAQLRSALDKIEMGIDALPDELECGDRMTAREMQRQALIIVKEEMKALKGPEA